MTDWSRVSRITNFCLSRLTTQSVINAKAEAIKESGKSWFATFEERNLSDPECHYEATLCKYSYPHYNEALDTVARSFEDLIRSTPSVLFGRLKFQRQVSSTSVIRGLTKIHRWGNMFIWIGEEGVVYLGLPIEKDFVNIYILEAEVW
jgi:hypothetical protein